MYLNAPEILTYNSQATAERSTASALDVIEIDVTEFLGQLTDGDNVLAVQGLNYTASDPDFLITAAMDSPDHIPPTAIQYSMPIIINTATTVKARTLGQRQWSVQNKADYTVTP